MDNIDILINLNKYEENNGYTHKIINICGPYGFTRIVMDNLTDKIKILPSDFFAGNHYEHGPPLTRNIYIRHHYTGSWR